MKAELAHYLLGVLVDAITASHSTSELLENLHRVAAAAARDGDWRHAEAVDALCSRFVRAWVGSWPACDAVALEVAA